MNGPTGKYDDVRISIQNIDAGPDDGVHDGTCQDWEIEAIAN